MLMCFYVYAVGYHGNICMWMDYTYERWFSIDQLGPYRPMNLAHDKILFLIVVYIFSESTPIF